MSYPFNIPFHNNTKLKHVIDQVVKDKQLNTLWKCSNIMAIDRLGFSDHGPTHAKMVANLALRLLRILVDSGVSPSIVKNYGMRSEDAEVVVVLGSILHDLGMVVARDRHDIFGAMLAKDYIEKYLEPLYTEEESTTMLSEVLHCIVTHEDPNRPLTVEAGIVRIADALDMEEGRARIPFRAGTVDIHSVSALAVEKVTIEKGGEKPVIIKIQMSNSAGIFQIDELLKTRIENSGLQDQFHVVAEITGEKERKIIKKYEF